MTELGYGLVGGIALFLYGFRLWRRLRLIEDTPTAKIRSMHIGRVELFGRAQERAGLRAPITGLPCAYYRYKVQVQKGWGRNRHWHTVEEGNSAASGFYLEDETGRVLVLPEGAKIELKVDYDCHRYRFCGKMVTGVMRGESTPVSRLWERTNRFGNRPLRIREWRIDPGERTYVLGLAQERGDLATKRRARIVNKLRALKRDPEAMSRLDTDGDGLISADEWEVARQLAIQDVSQLGARDRVVVAADPNYDTPFFIADRGETSVLLWHQLRSVSCIFGGALLSLVCLGLLVWFHSEEWVGGW